MVGISAPPRRPSKIAHTSSSGQDKSPGKDLHVSFLTTGMVLERFPKVKRLLYFEMLSWLWILRTTSSVSWILSYSNTGAPVVGESDESRASAGFIDCI